MRGGSRTRAGPGRPAASAGGFASASTSASAPDRVVGPSMPPPGRRLAALLEALAAAPGEGIGQEPEGMALLEALGFQVPVHVVTTGGEGVPDLDVFPGDRVVVKVLDPGIAHRTEVGGVQVVPRE